MDRRAIVLAALSPARGGAHTPVQVQKLLFLVDKKVAHLVGGPFFDFQPYHYGPFDRRVYDEIEALATVGQADIRRGSPWKEYLLTPEGQQRGEEIFSGLHPEAQTFIDSASRFVRSLSFQDLVQAIYKAFPDMRECSVFQDP